MFLQVSTHRSYEVIFIFQDGHQGIAILLPVSVFVILLIWESRNLPAYQILAKYLNPRLRYYYLQFLKTNPPRWNSTSGSNSYVCVTIGMSLHRCTKFRLNRTIGNRVMTSYSFLKMAAVGHIELSQGYCRPPTKSKWGSEVGPQIST